MSDSKRKYEEMLEDGYVPKELTPFLPRTLEQYIAESNYDEDAKKP